MTLICDAETPQFLLEKFYNKERRVLLKRLNFRCDVPEDAEDVLQESFARALTYIDSFDPERQELGAWFNTIMNNALRDLKQEQRLQGAVIPLEDMDTICTYDPETYSEELNKIKGFIAETPHPKALELYFFQGYSMSDIVKVEDIAYKNLHSLIYRFKIKMKEHFGELSDEVKSI